MIRSNILDQLIWWGINENRILLFLVFFFFFFFFVGLHLRHMVVSRLGAESELPLLAYVTATATRDLS